MSDNMQKEAFVNYRFDDEKEKDKHVVKSVKFNKKKELPRLELLQDLLQVEEHSVAMKQAIDIAISVLLEQKTLVILNKVLNNYRRNKRKGNVTYDDTNYEKFINRNSFL